MRILPFLVLVGALITLSPTRSYAYGHDSRGWYDDHHHRHPYIYYQNHRGYWEQDSNNGGQIFINS